MVVVSTYKKSLSYLAYPVKIPKAYFMALIATTFTPLLTLSLDWQMVFVTILV